MDASGLPSEPDPPVATATGWGREGGQPPIEDELSTQGDPLLAGIRRLALLADGAADPETIYRGLSHELMLAPGASEVHVHHLHPPPEQEELVVAYLFEGDGRLSYLVAPSERPPGVDWVAGEARSARLGDPEELAAALPRLAASSAARSALLLPLRVRADVEAVVTLVSADERSFDTRALELATTLVDQAATALALVRARAEAGTDAVTGCMNHRAMRRRLQEEIDRATRTGNPLSSASSAPSTGWPATAATSSW
jgi:GAF domain-containing protein